jgi:hypothetical protein
LRQPPFLQEKHGIKNRVVTKLMHVLAGIFLDGLMIKTGIVLAFDGVIKTENP